MKRTYIALVRKEAGTDYWIDIPDIPGCVSSGKTIEEAQASFAEAIDFHVEGMLLNRETIDEPRELGDVLASEKDSFVDHYEVGIDLTQH